MHCLSHPIEVLVALAYRAEIAARESLCDKWALSRRMRWLTALGLTLSSFAAFVTLRRRVNASKLNRELIAGCAGSACSLGDRLVQTDCLHRAALRRATQ